MPIHLRLSSIRQSYRQAAGAPPNVTPFQPGAFAPPAAIANPSVVAAAQFTGGSLNTPRTSSADELCYSVHLFVFVVVVFPCDLALSFVDKLYSADEYCVVSAYLAALVVVVVAVAFVLTIRSLLIFFFI